MSTPVALTAISGGINRLRTKGGADKNSLFDLLNGYVTQAGTVKVREGTYRNANIATYSGAGKTKGLMAFQSELHVFSSEVVTVPPGYRLHVLNYPANQSVSQNLTFMPGTFAGATQIGSGVGYGLVSGLSGFASAAIINPVPGADVGSVSPTLFLGVHINGFFQASPSSTHDPNEVYLVTSPALPTSATLSYNGPSGQVTVIAGNVVTTNLALPAGYFAYALGTGTPNYDTHFGSVSLLEHFDGVNGGTSFPDSSLNNLTASVFGTGSVTSATQKQFGPTSAHFNGSGGLAWPLSSGSPLDFMSSGDWTVEFWMYAGAQSGNQGEIFQVPSGPTNLFHVVYNTSVNSIVVEFHNSSGGGSANGSVSQNAWHAVAIQMASGTITTYIDGVQSGTPSTPSRASPNAGTLSLSKYSGGSIAPYVGYIDELRITKGFARYSGTYTPATTAFPTSLTLTYNNSAPFPLKEINFSAPYLGGIYVSATFDVTDQVLLDEFGDTFHYWVQSSDTGDTDNTWQANTDYVIGDVVIPSTPNGFTYIASRLLPPNPVWTPNTAETVGNIVEPTVANGFKFTATATLGATPTTGLTEPVWPTADGATVNENSSLENDQTITLATAASGAPPPPVPPRYSGGLAGGAFAPSSGS